MTLSTTAINVDDDNNNNNKSKYSSTRLRTKSMRRTPKHDDDSDDETIIKKRLNKFLLCTFVDIDENIMGSENSKTPIGYHPNTVPKSILKKQTSYPGTYRSGNIGYPQYANNYSVPYNGNYIQTQSKTNIPEDSSSSHPHHHSRRRHHHHHHHHRPQRCERETQTTPSISFRLENPIQQPLSITKDERSTPVFLRKNSSSNSLNGLSTPDLLEESSTSNSLDERSTSPIKKSTSLAVVKQPSSSLVNKKY
ncbi:unnamed protein product [Rotaria sp. Silwood2]|nr:unnamed protein product [Rotaria sp. Silwood2]CAF4291561.1 unnamed protein product [Rotaria sp. Silwood2]